jgi:hypothetical protein
MCGAARAGACDSRAKPLKRFLCSGRIVDERFSRLFGSASFLSWLCRKTAAFLRGAGAFNEGRSTQAIVFWASDSNATPENYESRLHRLKRTRNGRGPTRRSRRIANRCAQPHQRMAFPASAVSRGQLRWNEAWEHLRRRAASRRNDTSLSFPPFLAAYEERALEPTPSDDPMRTGGETNVTSRLGGPGSLKERRTISISAAARWARDRGCPLQ